MPQPSWGGKAKEQTRELLDALLAAVEGDLPPECRHTTLEWNEHSNILLVNTRMVELEFLMKQSQQALTKNQLRDSMLRLQQLGIYKARHQAGKTDIQFRLELWSRNRQENLTQFEQHWQQYKLDPNRNNKQPIPQSGVTHSTPIISEKCPYKGLSTFTQEDAVFFYGREEFTKDLLKNIKTKPLIAIVGNSGSGKSSVVYAGLIPELQKQGGWKFITFRPANNPFFELAYPLSSLLEPEKDKSDQVATAIKYAENFRTGKAPLKVFLPVTLPKELPNHHVLIFIDQFEELYTLCSEDERQNFIDQLLEVVEVESEKRSPDIVLVITLRSDFFGTAIADHRLREKLNKYNPKLIGEMNPDQLKAVIEKPAKAVNLTIQEGLTQIILDRVKNNPGELPLLQFCLEKLWQNRSHGQLTIAAYNDIGGVEKALANHAEELYQKLNEDEKNQLKHIFTQLVRFGENTEDIRRIATGDEIGSKNWQLVTLLASAEARLVIIGRDESKQQPTVEILHEALIRGWERLRNWMEEDRAFRKWQDRLRLAKNLWENSNNDHSVLLGGSLLVEAEDWLKKRSESITNPKEREFITVSRQYQEQENIERIQDLLTLSEKEFQLKQQLSSLVIAVKAGCKFRKIKQPSEEVKRKVVERLQQGSYEISEQNQLIGHEGEIFGLAFSRDGQIIASASDDRTIKLWDLNGNLLKTFKGHRDRIYGVSFSPDDQILASASADKTAKLWSLDGRVLTTLVGHSDRVYGVSFSPDGEMIASASNDKTAKLWSLDGRVLTTLVGHRDRVWGISFSPDSQMIASASSDRTLKLWSLDGTVLTTLVGHRDRVCGVSFSPTSPIIASASADRTVKLWSLDGTLLRTLEGHTDRVYRVSFSPDGEMIASVSADRTVRLWNLDGTLLRTLDSHRERVYGVSFSPDRQMIASASADRTIRLWSLKDTVSKTLVGHSDRVYGVSFSPTSQLIASGSADKTVRLWSLDGTLLRILEGHRDRVYGVSFSPDSQMIASASSDTTVRLWSLDGTLLRILEGHRDWVYSVSFSPDSQMIASASSDTTVRLWSLDGTLLRILEGHRDWVYGVSFSPNGEMIASASSDRTVRLWSLNGTLLRILEGHTDRVYGVSFSPTSQIIASSSFDRTVRLWSLDGTLLRTLKGHSDRVYGVSFSPDGQIIASVSNDKTVKLWSVDGTLLRTLEGHSDRVYTLSFSPTSPLITSASNDRTVKLWSIDPDDLILDLDVKLNSLLKKGCCWIRDYLQTNPNVSQSDRHLCDQICFPQGNIDC